MQEFEYSGKAMGTDYHLAVVCPSAKLANEAFAIAKSIIEAYEARFSRFLPESELSRLNENQDQVVSSTFMEVTRKARQLFEETKGVFNPLVQISRFGYDRDFDDLKDDDFSDESPYDIDFSATTIDTDSFRVRLEPGQKLDYGGFLKGYLAELIAKKIEAYAPDITGVVVNLGGDIHARGLDADAAKFVFYIYNPITQKDDFPITLHNQSLATSGTYKRYWMHSGKKTHHILDATGVPSGESDIVSASVVCKDGGRAEAYAKVFLLLGPEEGMKLLEAEPFSFLTIGAEGQITTNII